MGKIVKKFEITKKWFKILAIIIKKVKLKIAKTVQMSVIFF